MQISTKASAEGSLNGDLGSRSHGSGVRVSRDGPSLIEALCIFGGEDGMMNSWMVEEKREDWESRKRKLDTENAGTGGR